ncbi:hypothetical protein MIND_01287300 [Mycena indigotica]|uniref:F-box domain-containing protein n=1 Tax=Mycena indigotica TaxID=2126181 RepID=A0A8H6S2A5_9AGAR|nr:uncharacterized protein MIND_01287300 [Mycena indigotica]KAF7291426.1 hypothetical protein MIND_01287300 [Mycena indigotica]
MIADLAAFLLKSSSEPMASQSLPPEIWLDIFEKLPRTCLPGIVSTGRTFAVLARPLLFAHFYFGPYGLQSPNPHESRRQAVYLTLGPDLQQFDIDRIEFWTSENIAPLVRECSIVPWDPEETDTTFIVAEDVALRLLNVFFDRIHHFTRLHTFSAYDVTLTGGMLSKIFHCLPSLTSLLLNLGVSPVSESFTPRSLPPSLNKFILEMEDNELYSADSLQAYVPFFVPSSLRELCLSGPLNLWSTNPDAIPTFSNVRRLAISIYREGTNPKLAVVLPKFPNVKSLSLYGLDDTDEVFDAYWLDDVATGCKALLPVLQMVTTYFHIHSPVVLAIFMPGSTCLTCFKYHGRLEPDALLPFFSTFRLPSLVSLSVQLVGVVSLHSLKPIWYCFPALKHLDLGFSCYLSTTQQAYGTSVATEFLTTLYTSSTPWLPPMLKTLVLSWSFASQNSALYMGFYHAPIDLASLSTLLVARYPALRTIGIDGGSFLLKSRRRDLDGYLLVEKRNEDRNDQTQSYYTLRQEVSELWWEDVHHDSLL